MSPYIVVNKNECIFSSNQRYTLKIRYLTFDNNLDCVGSNIPDLWGNGSDQMMSMNMLQNM